MLKLIFVTNYILLASNISQWC